MKKTILLLFATPFLIVGKIQAQTENDNLTDGQKAYVLGKLCTEVKYNYVFYNDLAFDWDSLCQKALPSLIETNSYNEFVNGLRLITAKLNDGHTSVSGRSANNADWIKPLPFKTKRVGNQVFVTKVLNSELQEIGVKKGTEVIEIDGVNVIEYGDKYIKPYTASSTPQWLNQRPFSEFELTKNTGSKTSKILFKDKDGKTFAYESNRNIKWDVNDPNSIFDFQVLKGNIGVLKINTFMGNNFTDEFDKIYNEIEKTDKLIIDLRDNSGGNSNFANYILCHFSDIPIKQIQWNSRMYIAAHGSWGYPQEWYMQTPYDLTPIKNKIIYSKPIVVLTNAGTFSSSENFCAVFKGMKRGLIIGTTTGGSTGNPIMVDLGYDISALICTKNEVLIDGSKFIGVGIKPDIEVEETTDIFLNNKDVVIEEALLRLQ